MVYSLLSGDGRTYSYAVALSTERYPPDWKDMHYLAKLIPRVCHNVNRYVSIPLYKYYKAKEFVNVVESAKLRKYRLESKIYFIFLLKASGY